jgi:hypothetical protein
MRQYMAFSRRLRQKPPLQPFCNRYIGLGQWMIPIGFTAAELKVKVKLSLYFKMISDQ